MASKQQYTNWDGAVYDIYSAVVDEGEPWERVLWFADNFAYCADTRDDLIDKIDYFTRTWARQACYC